MKKHNYLFSDYGISPFQARSIASILAGRLQVKIKAAKKGWYYNFDDKTIYYDETDLKKLTETDVVANFMHEAGHAKYSIKYEDLKWANIVQSDHKDKLKHIVNCIEDFRVEDIMRSNYPYASLYLPEYSFKTLTTLQHFRQQLTTYSNKTGKAQVPRYIQYCFGIYSQLADTDLFVYDKDIAQRVEKTIEYAKKARLVNHQQKQIDIIGEKIYPHIKDLLDEFQPPIELSWTIVLVEKDGEEPKYPTYQELYAQVKPLIAPTVATFNRLLTDIRFDKYEGKFRSGNKLINKRLYKVKLNDFRLFQKRIERKNKDYVFSLVVDESGSMNYSKVTNAVRTAILFSHVMEKLKMPYSIHGFNRTFRNYKKPFQKFSKDTEEKLEQMQYETHTNDAGDTLNGMAIYQTMKILEDFSSKRVIFIITDSSSSDNIENAIKKAEQSNIEVIGVGIQDSSVEDYYQNAVYVDQIEDLPRTIFLKLKQTMKKRV